MSETNSNRGWKPSLKDYRAFSLLHQELPRILEFCSL